MKKISFLILFLSLSIAHYTQGFAIGAKFGVTFCSFYNVSQDLNYKPGLIIGISGQNKIANKIFLLSEIKYEQKGAKSTIKGLVFPNSSEHPYMDLFHTSKLNYLTLAILSKFFIGKKELFYLSIGPQLGYLLNAVSENKFIDSASEELIREEIRDLTISDGQYQINKLDFGLTTNAGVSFSIFENTKLFVEVNYNMSFSSINKYTSPKHIGFGLNTGILIGI